MSISTFIFRSASLLELRASTVSIACYGSVWLRFMVGMVIRFYPSFCILISSEKKKKKKKSKIHFSLTRLSLFLQSPNQNYLVNIICYIWLKSYAIILIR
jgi:hypothetical protein